MSRGSRSHATFPTSPNAIGASESYPSGREVEGDDRPVCPCSRRYRTGGSIPRVANPAYCRIVQKRRGTSWLHAASEGKLAGKPASRSSRTPRGARRVQAIDLFPECFRTGRRSGAFDVAGARTSRSQRRAPPKPALPVLPTHRPPIHQSSFAPTRRLAFPDEDLLHLPRQADFSSFSIFIASTTITPGCLDFLPSETRSLTTFRASGK